MNLLRKPSFTLLMSAMGLSLSLSAHAANMSTAGSSMNRSTDATVSRTASSTHAIRASKLIGKDVTNAQGQNLGEIDDLVIDTANGNVDYAVLSFGGLMGLGDKLFAYPLEQFKSGVGKDGDKLVLNVDKKMLEGAPGFEKKNWPDFNKGDYRTRVDEYHHARARAAHPRYVRASEMLNGDVKDSKRKDIGDIDDVVVDLSSGKVEYVVVEFDRAWNPFDKLVAMPLRVLTSEDRDGTDLVYSASRDELKSAPAFKKSDWPDLANDSRFRNDVNRWDKRWKAPPQKVSQTAPR